MANKIIRLRKENKELKKLVKSFAFIGVVDGHKADDLTRALGREKLAHAKTKKELGDRCLDIDALRTNLDNKCTQIDAVPNP